MTHEVDRRLASPTALLGLLGGDAEPTIEATGEPDDQRHPSTAPSGASDPASFLDQLSAPQLGETSSTGSDSSHTRLALVKEPVGMQREMTVGGESDFFVDHPPDSHRSDEDQYGPVRDVRAADVALGDLLLIEDLDEWVVVDTDPELDIIDHSLLP
jgi:hypothetical protein